MDPAKHAGAVGFTLVEVLVALALAGMVALGVHAAVQAATDIAARGPDRLSEALRVEAARTTIREWLEGAARDFETLDRASAQGPADEIAFVTLDPGPCAADPETPVRVRLRVTAAGGLIADCFAAQPPPPGRGGSLSLLPEVRGLNVRYRVTVFGQPQWFDVWSAKARLPEAVELRFSVAAAPAPGAARPEPLSIPLVVSLPGQASLYR